MSIFRDRLQSNFLPLRDAVDAIGCRIKISVKEVDGYRSLNCSKDEGSFATKSERAVVGRMLRQAHASERLIQLLNQGSEPRPIWRESVSGYSVLNDAIGREGSGILIQWANQKLPRPHRPPSKWDIGPISEIPPIFGPPPREVIIGFDVDEFIRFLDSNRVPHDLGAPANNDKACSIEEDQQGSALVAPIIRKGLPDLKFKGPLEEILNKALQAASDTDPWNPLVVFSKLKAIARREREMDPNSWIWVDEPLVKYRIGKRVFQFNKRNMTDRYRQLKRSK